MSTPNDGEPLDEERAARKDVAARRKLAYGRAVAAFQQEGRRPAYRWSSRLVMTAALLPIGYVLWLRSCGPAFRGAWIADTQGLTDIIGIVVPSVRGIAADLVRRGFPGRAGIVGHLLAMQWLLFALQFLGAFVLLLPERASLRRGFAAAVEYSRLRGPGRSRPPGPRLLWAAVGWLTPLGRLAAARGPWPLLLLRAIIMAAVLALLAAAAVWGGLVVDQRCVLLEWIARALRPRAERCGAAPPHTDFDLGLVVLRLPRRVARAGMVGAPPHRNDRRKGAVITFGWTDKATAPIS